MPTEFEMRVYELTRRIPEGKVSTYKAIAEKLGCRSYRAVGQALRKNPFAPDVPCHRVVGADGKLCGFKGKSTGFTLQEKRKMLEREGIRMEEGSISLERYFYAFL